MKNDARGVSLSEVMVVLAIVAISIAVAAPAFATMRRRSALRAAMQQTRAILHAARMRAIARGSHSAVRFTLSGGTWMVSLYDDGDGDGVRTDDIRSGVDRLIQPPQPLLAGVSSTAHIGMPPESIPDPDSGRPIAPTASPIRFGASSLCSFGPVGGGTAGSVFITDGTEVAMVRVYGTTGRIRSLRYGFAGRRWEKR